MRVLMTGDNVGGVWRYALELADALVPHGVEVTLAASGAPLRPEQRDELRVSRFSSARHRALELEWMDDPWDDVERTGEWLLRTAAEVRPDVVHLNAYAHAALPWDAPCLVVGHSCVLSWFRAVRGTPAPPEWDRYARTVEAGLAAADHLVAPTRAMLAELRRLYQPRCELRAIPNGVRPLGAPVAKEPFVLGAGRLWDEAKNAAALDRVAPSLPWPVLLAGEADAVRPPLHARLLGHLAAGDLAALMARAAIYAAPARYEPFGLAALEAAHAGCALVLGDVPSLREVWGDAALFVDPGDDAALAAALRLLIDEEPRRCELAARARERAARYTPERMAAAYVDVYRRLLEGARVEVAA